ncbi:MAG: SDR family NAD(P)-dependent oxidoreductase [Ignavibacterium sp.]|jgi:NAD(P)-dependent dehydrogenase (short-subunit alcohol dehydrogenase family)|nr:SDR family NAD(P)-dependent oxidoreductase [Ignavibacterium sp.]
MIDRKLIVFGASGALGKGVVKTLIQKPFKEIILFDRKFEETFSDERIKTYNIKDMSVENNVLAALHEVNTSDKTQLHLFSTIGGYYGGTSVWETEEQDFDRMININVKSNFFIAKHFVSLVKRSYSGSICFTSAFTSLQPEKLKFVYGASKSALNYLVQSLADEGKSINLSVNAIAPYIIDTPSNREWQKNADYTTWIKSNEIGELVYSLIENHNFVSGNILRLKYRFNK